MESRGGESNRKTIPESLEEAYELRDTATTAEDRDFYRECVYRLRAQEYFSRRVWTDELLRRRERRGLGVLRKEVEEARRPWYKRILGWK